MAISLPSSPTIGQTYTLGGKIWTWNGTAWKLPSTTGVLPVLYGGTGVTTSTGTGNNVLSADPTFTGTVNTAAITTSGNVGVGGALTTASIIVSGTATIAAYTETTVALGTVTTAATIAINVGTIITATLSMNIACFFTMPTVAAGKSFILLLKQAASVSVGPGSAYFTNVKWGSAGAPAISVGAGKMDILSFVSDGTSWYGSAAQGYTY